MSEAKLIERVEKLAGPDRAVDLDIARALAPDVIVLRHNRETGVNEPHTYWEYTGKIDAAVALVERVLPGYVWSVSDGDDHGPFAFIHRKDDKSPVGSMAATPAIALVLALLRQQEEGHGG